MIAVGFSHEHVVRVNPCRSAAHVATLALLVISQIQRYGIVGGRFWLVAIGAVAALAAGLVELLVVLMVAGFALLFGCLDMAIVQRSIEPESLPR